MLTICNDSMDINRVNHAVKFLKLNEVNITAKKDETMCGYVIEKDNEELRINYGASCDLFRALLYISQNRGMNKATATNSYQHLGYMIDVARNAVPKVDTLKRMVDYLAVLGYDRLYIYLEDLFEVKGEPFFGYLRGRYSEEELKELDEYCYGYGIELVPCIQTLAHLNAIFKWQEYDQCCDTADILLVGDERTEKLIKNMFEAISRVFRTKTLHVGMDEAHLVGRGKYLDENGYKTGYEVMAEHIKKVVALAEPFGFELMIWSDMYFRLAFGGEYYSMDGGLSEEIRSQIPKNITLTYWDYFTQDYNMLSHMMDEHIKTGNKVSFAGGAWKWTGWNPSTKLSLLTAKAALDVCQKENLKDIMLTAWSDDGAEASLFTTLPVVAYYADRRYNEQGSEARIDKLLKDVFGLSLNDFLTADMPLINKDEFEENELLGKLPKILIYNDPLSGVYDGIIQKYDNINKEISKHAKMLASIKRNSPIEFKYIFENLENLCKVLQYKATLGIDIRKSYQTKNIEALKLIANKRIPSLIKSLKTFEKGFYIQWMKENKSNGYQTHDFRLGGLIKRLYTVKLLLNDYINGKISEIDELRDQLINIEDGHARSMLLWKDWKYMASVYIV